MDGSTTGAQSNPEAPRRRAPPRGPAVDAWAMEMELLAPTGALAMQAAGGQLKLEARGLPQGRTV